jgi:hypothetical protein
MNAFAGYNYHARNFVNKPRALSHYSILKPRASVVMDDFATAQELKAISPSTLVIYRHYGTDGDENDYLQYTARAYLDSRRQYAQNGIAIYVLNEPPFNETVIKWLIDVIELNEKEYHFTLVIGNFATGNPTGNVIEQWALAHKLLVLLDKYRDHIYLGLHQYCGAVITSGLYGGYPDKAGEKQLNLIPPANWPKTMVDDGQPITRFHVGREWFLKEYCQIVGIPAPRVIITEALFDDTSDIDGWLKSLPVTAPYLNVRGFKSLRAVWKKWFPEWSVSRAYFEQLKYAIEVIWRGGLVEAVCLFCWGHSSKLWEQFDLEDELEFQDLLVAYAQTGSPTMPAPTYPTPPTFPFKENDWRAVTMKINARDSAKNLRAGPGTQYQLLRQFVSETVTFIPFNMLDANQQYIDGEGQWIPLLLDGKEYWVAAKVVIEDLVNYQKAPPPIPPLPGDDDEPEDDPLDDAVVFNTIVLQSLIRKQISEIERKQASLAFYRSMVEAMKREIDEDISFLESLDRDKAQLIKEALAA